MRALDVSVSNTFPQVEVCSHREGVLLLESSVMNRRLAPCLIKFHHSLISILPSKNVQHTMGFIDLSEQTARVQALPCKVCS